MLTEALTNKTVRQSSIICGDPDYESEENHQYTIGKPDLIGWNLNAPFENTIPPVDDWYCYPEDQVFRSSSCKKVLVPVSKVLIGEEDLTFDEFILSSRKCYTNEDTVTHILHYLNYLEKYYDEDHYLISVYARIKYMIDTNEMYTKEDLLNDIKRDILFGGFRHKVRAMNQDNYKILIKKNKENGNVLQYNNRHLIALMEVSLFQLCIIPLLTHYAFRHQENNMDRFLMYFYEYMINNLHPDMDLFVKLGETTNSRILQNSNKNQVLWDKQLIRSRNKISHNIETVVSIVVQIMPKFIYSLNILNLIYTTIKGNINNKVLRAKFEYSFKQLSSDRNEGDDEENSEFDKFESHLAKKNEALLMHNQVNFEMTMKKIEERFGPFSREEINYYRIELSRDKKSPVDKTQRTLVFYLFYKYFGDPHSLGAIDVTSYIKLILAAKRILAANGLYTMEAILSGRFVKVINRTNMNKKELQKIMSSSTYKAVSSVYETSEKVSNLLISLLATIVSSKFQIIDFENKEMTGKPFVPQQELLNEEFLIYASLINK